LVDRVSPPLASRKLRGSDHDKHAKKRRRSYKSSLTHACDRSRVSSTRWYCARQCPAACVGDVETSLCVFGRPKLPPVHSDPTIKQLRMSCVWPRQGSGGLPARDMVVMVLGVKARHGSRCNVAKISRMGLPQRFTTPGLCSVRGCTT